MPVTPGAKRLIPFTATQSCVRTLSKAILPIKRSKTNPMSSNQISVRDANSDAAARFMVRRIFALVVFALATFTWFSATAQTRDHLTDPESELVRDNQQLDKRVEVFIKAIDRRFAIITGAPQFAPKKKEKTNEGWGEPPTGTHAQLLEDIAGILDEAI